MSSGRFYIGQIGAIYLTSDGSAEAKPAKIEVTGDDGFVDDIGETITTAADGALHAQAVDLPAAAGRAFEIKILFCPSELLASLEDAIKATRGTEETVRVQLSSVKRVIDVQAKANGNGWLTTGKFSGDVINDVTLRLISTGAGGA
jgi:hypothetical protein